MWKKIEEQLEAHKKVMLITIMEKQGSGPRNVGTKMAVFEDGMAAGTIGGGSVEYCAVNLAKNALLEDREWEEWFDLGNPEAAELGMVCGGTIKLQFEILTAQDVEQVKRLCKERKKKDRVYIFGAGHVAKELVPVLEHLDFSCIVLDDREQFANKERFPQAEQILITDFSDLVKCISVTKDDYVVIMTRGHQQDYKVQLQMLKQKPYYIGVMGSKNKIAYVSGKLEAEGCSKEEVAACYMPIGTKIQAQTPEEIAISIAGELILKRAEKRNK